MFKKRNWTKWEHVMFVQEMGSNINTFELLRRVDQNSGVTQYKSVYVKQYVHSLSHSLMNWWKDKNVER